MGRRGWRGRRRGAGGSAGRGRRGVSWGMVRSGGSRRATHCVEEAGEGREASRGTRVTRLEPAGEAQELLVEVADQARLLGRREGRLRHACQFERAAPWVERGGRGRVALARPPRARASEPGLAPLTRSRTMAKSTTTDKPKSSKAKGKQAQPPSPAPPSSRSGSPSSSSASPSDSSDDDDTSSSASGSARSSASADPEQPKQPERVVDPSLRSVPPSSSSSTSNKSSPLTRLSRLQQVHRAGRLQAPQGDRRQGCARL